MICLRILISLSKFIKYNNKLFLNINNNFNTMRHDNNAINIARTKTDGTSFYASTKSNN